jgi:predicted MFS family arabinose efflux permease
MPIAPYCQVLALPGVRALFVVSMLARIPFLAGSMVLTLHVVTDLGMGFGAAGSVFSAAIFGSALGAPVLGRMTDRYGLRPVIVVGTAAAAVFWATLGAMTYPVLLVAGFLSSLVQVPVFTVSRQALAALVPQAQRRPAYSLDSVTVELAYMTGPALGVLLVTQVSTRAAGWVVWTGVLLAGTGLYLLNPRLRSESEQAGHRAGVRVPVRQWLRPAMLAVLVTVTGATLVLGATDVVVVAVLKNAGELAWAGLVLPAWGAYSMLGGLVYGGLPRVPGPIGLMLFLGLCTVPLALAGDWVWLCVALLPAGVMCTPTLAAASDAMSRLAPAAVRGEAMGYYGSALNVGMALGAPLAGVVVDVVGASWGFVVAGGIGVLVAGLAGLVNRVDRRRGEPEQAPSAGVVPAYAAGQ